MRTQIWIIAGAFVLFGIMGWAAIGTYSPTYLVLMAFGGVCLLLGWVLER
jgi:hypothetical protein